MLPLFGNGLRQCGRVESPSFTAHIPSTRSVVLLDAVMPDINVVGLWAESFGTGSKRHGLLPMHDGVTVCALEKTFSEPINEP